MGVKRNFHLEEEKSIDIFWSKFRVPKHFFLGWLLVKRHVASVTYLCLEDAGIIPLCTQKLVHFREKIPNKMGSYERNNKQE